MPDVQPEEPGGWVRLSQAARTLGVHRDTVLSRYAAKPGHTRKSGRFWEILLDTPGVPQELNSPLPKAPTSGFVKGWEIALEDHIELRATVRAQKQVIEYLERLVPGLGRPEDAATG